MNKFTMTAKEAVEYVAKEYGVKSLYEMAQLLSTEDIYIAPIQISNYKSGKRMSVKVAKRFDVVYGLTISNVYNPGVFTK